MSHDSRIHKLYLASQVQAIDRHAIEELQIGSYKLMQKAASFCVEKLLDHWPHIKSATIYAGAGNNAGDGFIVARLLREKGLQTEVFTLVDAERYQGDAKKAYDSLVSVGLGARYWQGQEPAGEVVIDALMGLGALGGLRPSYSQAIDSINRSGKPVLAIDLPSGLHPNTGHVAEKVVHADVTCTFVARKQGLYTGAAAECVGRLYFSSLKIPEATSDAQLAMAHLATGVLLHAFRKRSRISHKGSFGNALLAGGDYGMAGAIVLAGQAAARVGAGLVSVGTRAEHVANVVGAQPECMAAAVESHRDINPLLERATAIGVGPGLGQGSWGERLLERAIAAGKPMVVDADALNLLVMPSFSEVRPHKHWILTPHPGEAARMLACSTQDIACNRFQAAQELQAKFGGTVVLKGAGTLICDADEMWVCPLGNPGMASGGMGDVLTGIITGLLAQKWSMSEAARLGVVVHAVAADIASDFGERGMLASDVITQIRTAVNP